MILKFKRADGVRYALDSIFLTMSEIIRRVNHPIITCLMMAHLTNAVQNGIAHIHVG